MIYGIPADDLPEGLKNILQRLRSDIANASGMRDKKMIPPNELLGMEPGKADDIFEEYLNQSISNIYQGFDVRITITERGLAHRVARQALSGSSGVAHHTPEYIRDAVSAEFANRIASVGGEMIGISWEVRYAPRVQWRYEGHEYEADFMLDGTLEGSNKFVVREPWTHTIESTVVEVAPRLTKKDNL